MKIWRVLCALTCAGWVAAANAAVQNFSGTTSVNVTSDTAAMAKTRALDSARRQIIRETIAPYTNAEQFDKLMSDASASDLAGLILTSRIDGERQSSTTYTATVSMTVDGAAVQKWLNANNVQSWLPDTALGNRVPVVINMRNRMADWAELNSIARGENIDLMTRNITGNQVIIELPDASRRAFIAAARAAGWQYSDNDGNTHLWK